MDRNSFLIGPKFEMNPIKVWTFFFLTVGTYITVNLGKYYLASRLKSKLTDNILFKNKTILKYFNICLWYGFGLQRNVKNPLIIEGSKSTERIRTAVQAFAELCPGHSATVPKDSKSIIFNEVNALF